MFKKTNFNYDKQRQHLRLDFRTLVTPTKRKAVHNPEKAVGIEEMGGKTKLSIIGPIRIKDTKTIKRN